MRGAGVPTKLLPPSSVRRMDVHGGLEHGALPNSHHVVGPIAVNDSAPKPGGTGPAGAWTWRGAVALAGALVLRRAAVDVCVEAWWCRWV